jgi:hypothetical protein
MTGFEKNIYNSHLRISRSSQNLPFKLRKNFYKFEDTAKYVYVKKLSLFFKKYDHLNIDDYFSAPYKIYPDSDFFDLKFFTTQKAIKAYSLYKQAQQNTDPDSEEQIKFTTDSLYFIYEFCKQNNINLRDYTSHKIGPVNTFITHLNQSKVNIYSLFGFQDFEQKIKQADLDVVKFIIPNIIENLGTFRSRFYSSKKLKHIVRDGSELIYTSLSS